MASLPNTRLVQIQSNKNPFRFVSADTDLGQVHRVHLKSFILPNTEYNVNSKTNTVAITGADMLAVANLPLGQYNITDLLNALKVVLDVASAPNTFTVSQSPLTKKLIFTKSGGAEFTIAYESPFARIVGQHSLKTSVGLTLTTESIPDLSGLRLATISSYTLGRHQISEGDTPAESQKTNILGALPMTAPFGGLLKYESDESTLNATYFSNYHNVSNFDIALVDSDGELIELNGTEWLISLEMHILGAQ
jgi:hypothetical protein